MEQIRDVKLLKAQKKVKKLKEFYTHVLTYVLVNLFITFVWKFTFTIFGDFVISNQYNESGFIHIPIWFIWGVLLVLDAIATFGFTGRFGRDWEERKIQEFIKDKQ
jgi:hypothetical protein